MFALISVAFETAKGLLDDPTKAAKLPFFVIFAKKICEGCFQRAWFSKSSARHVISRLIDYMPSVWICEHGSDFFHALLFIIRDLADEVSFGVVEETHDTLWKLVKSILSVKPDKLSETAKDRIVRELVREIISPSDVVRKFSQDTLHKVAKELNTTVTAIIKETIERHKDILAICPFKTSGKTYMYHKAIPLQIGILDGSAFCLSLQPRLFQYDCQNSTESHAFLIEVFKIMSNEEAFMAHPCYKKWMTRNDYGWSNSLEPLKITAMKVMCQCFYISELRDDIFSALFQNMTQTDDPKLMKAGEECLEVFLAGTNQSSETEIIIEVIHRELRPILTKIGNYADLNHSIIERLAILSRLFPNTFNLKLCDTLMAHLQEAIKKMVEQVNLGKSVDDLLKMSAAICEVFPLIQQAYGLT